MHIIIGFITALAGLIWAFNTLQRSGFDLNSLNPFAWARRRKWQKLSGIKPMYNLKQPIEAATLIIVASLKEIGEITTEQKNHVLSIFETHLHLDSNSAKEAFVSAIFMIKNELNFPKCVAKVLAPSKHLFSSIQSDSLIKLIDEVIKLEGDPNENQLQILKTVQAEFNNNQEHVSRW